MNIVIQEKEQESRRFFALSSNLISEKFPKNLEIFVMILEVIVGNTTPMMMKMGTGANKFVSIV